MTNEEKNNSDTQVGIIEKSPKQTGSSWYGLGLGLAGGVVGALVVTIITPLFQAERTDDLTAQIAAQADRIEEAKLQQEQEFSRISTRIADLDGNSQKHAETLAQLGSEIEQLTAEQEKGFTRIYDTLVLLDDADRQHNQTVEAFGEHSAQLQNLTQATVDLSEEIDGVKDRLTQIEARGAAQPSQAAQEQANWRGEIALLKEQIEGLESQIALLPKLIQRLDDEKEHTLSLIDGQNASLEGMVANMEEAEQQQARAVEAMQQAIEALSRDVASLAKAPPIASDKALATLIAANSLKTAVDRGGSYNNEWQVFASLAPEDPAFEILEKYADSGLPNVAELSTRFAKIADEIAASDNVLPEDAGLTDQLLHQGSRLYSARPVGEVEGTDASAIVARMEVAIGKGDFSRALSEAQALPAQAKAFAADFIDLLVARENADQLLSRLIATNLQEE